MNLSFDGLRLNLQREFNKLFDFLQDKVSEAAAEKKESKSSYYKIELNKSEMEQLKQKSNKLGSNIAGLLCVYSEEGTSEVINDLSDKEEVMLFTDDEEDEPEELNDYY